MIYSDLQGPLDDLQYMRDHRQNSTRIFRWSASLESIFRFYTTYYVAFEGLYLDQFQKEYPDLSAFILQNQGKFQFALRSIHRIGGEE